jgi:hypothetical protein
MGVFTSARMGFKDERVLSTTPQTYGELFVIRVDGTGLRRLTDNQWEDGTPIWFVEPVGKLTSSSPSTANFVADSPVARITRTPQTRRPVLASSGRMVDSDPTWDMRIATDKSASLQRLVGHCWRVSVPINI